MVLSGAYIWNGVTVDDNCEVQRALLDDNVHLYRNTKIQQGCVLAAGVSPNSDQNMHFLWSMSDYHVKVQLHF